MSTIMLTVILVFLFPSGNKVLAKRVCRNNLFANPYPGLTLANARCPNDTTWAISAYYNNQPRCFGPKAVPSTLTDPLQLIPLCQQKNPNAFPASMHSADEIAFCSDNNLNGAFCALYLPDGLDFAAGNFKNLDNTPVDFTPFDTSSGSTSTNAFAINTPNMFATSFVGFIKPGLANAICAMWAEPIY